MAGVEKVTACKQTPVLGPGSLNVGQVQLAGNEQNRVIDPLPSREGRHENQTTHMMSSFLFVVVRHATPSRPHPNHGSRSGAGTHKPHLNLTPCPKQPSVGHS